VSLVHRRKPVKEKAAYIAMTYHLISALLYVFLLLFLAKIGKSGEPNVRF
jgi:hypothetical protein